MILAKANVKKIDQYMYIGPNLLREGLQRFQVYKGGLPSSVDALKEKYPLIKQLFVKTENINIAMQAVQQDGTPAFLAYQQILKGGVKDGV